ncbi:hypothetical protein AB0B42_00560 [Streptomyces fradiae]|uniref:hypothetical protein n=1 Tax=Streptomyces fradiae TaxID=1906 RepID=UPI0033DE33AE
MTTTTTTAHHLRTIALHWTDLHQALGDRPIHGAFGRGLRDYLRTLEQYDREEVAALRALERDPAQIGERPVPISLRVYETMRTVESALIELADQTAADVQRPAMARAPRHWPAPDRARRDALADADATDPRRWRYTGRRTAPHAALWLCALIEGRPGPWRPLTDAHRARIGRVAAGALHRIETTLDTSTVTATLTQRCACGSVIEIHGGAGTPPLARCTGCGRTWRAPEPAVA